MGRTNIQLMQVLGWAGCSGGPVPSPRRRRRLCSCSRLVLRHRARRQTPPLDPRSTRRYSSNLLIPGSTRCFPIPFRCPRAGAARSRAAPRPCLMRPLATTCSVKCLLGANAAGGVLPPCVAFSSDPSDRHCFMGYF